MAKRGALWRMTGVVATVLLVAGCSKVTTVGPLSADPKPIDREMFEGIWIIDDDPYVIKFGEDGVARIGAVYWEDGQFNLGRGEMIVAEGKENNFVSVRFQEDGEWPDDYLFAQYKFVDNGDLVIWQPRVSEFEDAVEEGLLQGEAGRRSVVITSPPEKVLEFLNDPERGDLFDYRDPKVYRRILFGPGPGSGKCGSGICLPDSTPGSAGEGSD